MITKYSELYDALFEKADKRLEDLGITDKDGNKIHIESLEEYFSHLGDLVNGPEDGELTEEQKEAGYLFLKLPLDEPAFVINANDRTITIPDNFKKNGLSVVGDEVAEIVFFEIDRFYDAADLSLMQISIEWEIGKEEGHTPAFIRDIESKAQEDKLIFGWPITSNVTATAGKIKFAVRFYQSDANGKYTYSFSTLPQTITINSSLNLDVNNIKPDDATNLILGRVLNSPLGGIGQAAIPYFVYYTPEGTINEQIESFTLYALGQKGDSGSLSYKWLFNDSDLIEGEGYLTSLERGAYIEVAEWIPNHITYFKLVNGKYEKIECTSASDFKTELTLAEKLYVLCSAYELTAENVQAGQYSVDLKNTYYGTNSSAEKKLTWTVAGANEPSIIQSEQKEMIIDGTSLAFNISNADDYTTYSWSKKVDESIVEVGTDATYEPTEEGYYNLTVTNNKNNDSKSATSADILCVYEVEEITKDNLVITPSIGKLSVSIINRPLAKFESEPTYAWRVVGNSQVISTTSECDATVDNSYEVTVTISKGSITSTSATAIYPEA